MNQDASDRSKRRLKKCTSLALIIAGFLGLTAVVAGTFGAHGLKSLLSESNLQTFDVGVRYHLVHAAAFVGLLGVSRAHQTRWLRIAGALWCGGVVLFSGSLYALAITDAKWLAWITPIGGGAFVAGWLCICIAGLTRHGDCLRE